LVILFVAVTAAAAGNKKGFNSKVSVTAIRVKLMVQVFTGSSVNEVFTKAIHVTMLRRSY
jgi:TRAP-type uncharacterized transport system fused permease subunit